ncbi:MAG: hypothetical protein J6O41_01115 [Clostridia bacterium]|nr:hypothetical protein [Clostridia bacterium]
MSKIIQLKDSSGNIYPITRDVYSTSEVKTDKILFGKPVYRKSFTLTTLAGANNINVSDLKIDFIHNIILSTKQPSGNFNQLYKLNDTDFCNAYYRSNDKVIRITCGSSYGFGNTKLTVEYTKTTD